MSKNKVLDGLFGLCIGDALGVPVEFTSRDYLAAHPIKDMTGFGTHNQPPGTWSDDSSLSFCLADSLCRGYDIYDIADKFVSWFFNGLWTPYGEVFDIGNTTRKAILTLKQAKVHPAKAGAMGEHSNGNGSLMRILPLAFVLQKLPLEKRIRVISDVSSITHAHIRSVIACVIYIEMALTLLKDPDVKKAYDNMKPPVLQFYKEESEIRHFTRILKKDISILNEAEIRSSGYVVHTLEASLWCLLRNKSFKQTVLAAVNLGEDTDTTGAVTGGLAGLYYGMEGIPEEWVNRIAGKNDIVTLAKRLDKAGSNIIEV